MEYHQIGAQILVASSKRASLCMNRGEEFTPDDKNHFMVRDLAHIVHGNLL